MSPEEKVQVEALALQIFLKKMPTTPLTDETRRGFLSTMEQSVEIAQLFHKKVKQLLEVE